MLFFFHLKFPTAVPRRRVLRGYYPRFAAAAYEGESIDNVRPALRYRCRVPHNEQRAHSLLMRARINRAGQSRTLNAFLYGRSQSQASEARPRRRVSSSWCTSTKGLQLASLEFCAACRNVPIRHLSVCMWRRARLLPEYGWRTLERPGAPRGFQRCTWACPSSSHNEMEEVSSRCEVWVMCCRRRSLSGSTNAFNGDLGGGIVWPCELKVIELGQDFDQLMTEGA